MAKATPQPAPTAQPGKNPFVGIAGTIGGTLIAMLAIIGIFANEHSAAVMPPVAFAMALLGIFLGYFAYKKA